MGFSNSNRRTNYLDNPHNLLVKEFIRVVKTNPATQIFVLENVGQLLTTGNGVYKREVYDVLSDFEITSGIVSAADMGAPQLRKRAILIGSKIGKIPLPGKAVNAFRTVREAFSGLTESVPNQLDFTKSKPETVERMKQVPEGGNFSNLVEERAKNHHSNYMRRLAWDRPSVTIVNFRKSPILHPSENRTLSVRECARLFGVPDDFVFYGPLAEKQQQVANGVPVPMAAAIARVIKERIIAYQREKGLVFA